MTPIIYGPGPEQAPPLKSLPDLAGLPADDVRQRPVGEVVGVLTESSNGLIRYLDIGLNGHARHVLVPIGHVRIEEHADGLRVRLRAASREDLDEIPAFDPETADFGTQYESELLVAFSRLFYGEHYYAHPAYDHSRLYAGSHPIVAGETPADLEDATLYPLSQLAAWRVADGEPDIRGWPVLGGDDAELGRVRDLLIDPEAERVRYASVDTDGGDGHLLLPIGYLSLEPSADRVRARALRRADLADLPRRSDERAALTRADERALLDAIEALLTGDRRFDRPDFSTPLPPTAP